MNRGTIRLGNKRSKSTIKPKYEEVQVHIDRPNILRNTHLPQTPLMIDREVAIEEFKIDLLKDLGVGGPMSKEIYRIVELLKSGHDVILMCWCTPKACHGDIIIEVIEKLLIEETTYR
jgi:hypothetical protein